MTNKVNIRRITAILLLAAMLLTLCGCSELFANFNDGMTEEDYEYDAEKAERFDRVRNKIIVIVLGLIIGGIGAFKRFNPRDAWRMSEGWKYENVEPSKLNLALGESAGIIMMLLGGIALLVGILM